MDARTDTDVLIIGAGPTGLTLAIALRRRGVSCRIVDKNDAPTTQSRAIAIHARTLELFAEMGVVDDILATGVRWRAFAYCVGGRERVRLPLHGIAGGTPYPFIHGLPQNETERVLHARLIALGGWVERGVALASLAHGADGVVAILARADGVTETVRPRYLVGCDGAHSAVRHALGVPFVGQPYADTYWLADVHLEWREPPGVLFALLGEGEVAGVFPLDAAGRYRIVAQSVQGAADTEPTLADVQAMLDRLAPMPVRLHDPAWLSAFRLHHRKATRYREGCVFLAGDAAHIHSPIGGQGMNTGIQDAANLAWKLEYALRGAATDALLESYHTERAAVGEQVLRTTDVGFRAVRSRNPRVRWLRDVMLTHVLPRPPVRRRFLINLAQLAIRYAPGAVVARDPGGSGVKTGLRAPDAALVDADGNPTRLMPMLAAEPGRYTLLLFTGTAVTAGGVAALARLAARVRERHGAFVAPVWIVGTRRGLPDTAGDAPRYTDPAGETHRIYGAKGATMYLVRPDGYVAFRGQATGMQTGDALLAHLGGLCLPVAPPVTSGTLVA